MQAVFSVLVPRIYDASASFLVGPQGATGADGIGVPGNAIIPFQPMSIDTLDTEQAFVGRIWYCQFIAPTTGKYTYITIFTTFSSSISWSGSLGVAIYADSGLPNLPPGDTANGAGPTTFIVKGVFTGTATNMGNRFVDIPLDMSGNGANLIGGTKYWIGIVGVSTVGNAMFPYDQNFHGHLNTHCHDNGDNNWNGNTNLFPASGQTNISFTTGRPFWFRISDPSASFLMGPQGFTGATGADGLGVPGNPALPIAPGSIFRGAQIYSPDTKLIIYNKFIASCTATYTSIQFTLENPASFTGSIGGAIYEDDETVVNAGVPKDLLASGKLDFSTHDVRQELLTIQFTTPVELVANRSYWMAFAYEGNQIQVYYDDGAHSGTAYPVGYEESNGYTTSTGFDPVAGSRQGLVNNPAPLWYRIFDPAASFLLGPTGPQGEPGVGTPGNPAIPYEVYNYQNLAPTLGLTNGQTYYNSFICPSTATYTAIDVYTSSCTSSGPWYIGAAIYANEQSTGIYIAMGQPVGPPLGEGIVEIPYSVPYDKRNSVHTCNLIAAFDGSLNLIANTRYWVAMGTPTNTVGTVFTRYPQDNAAFGAMRTETNSSLSIANGFPTTVVSTPDTGTILPFWFRVYDPSSQFMLGPQGVVGPTGADGVGLAGNSALPYEPHNADILGDTVTLTPANVYYMQFIAPSTGTYTALDVLIAGKTPNAVSGTLGAAVYSSSAGGWPDQYTGSPITKLGEGSKALTDGTGNWASSATSKRWSCVAMSADGTILVAAEYGGKIWTSYTSGNNVLGLDPGGGWTPRGTTDSTGGVPNRYWLDVAMSDNGQSMIAVEADNLNEGGGRGKIWVSFGAGEDGGGLLDVGKVWTSWTITPNTGGGQSPYPKPCACCCSADGNIMAVAASGGDIWISWMGGGKNMSGVSQWNKRELQGGGGGNGWSGIACSANGTIIAACAINSFVYVSWDAGMNWSTHSCPYQQWTSVCMDSTGMRMRATVLSGNIWTSENGGVTWTQRVVGAGNLEWSDIKCSRDGVKLIAAAGYGHTGFGAANPTYFSYDMGVTWSGFGYSRSDTGWLGVASSADGTKLAAVFNGPHHANVSTNIYMMGYPTGGNGYAIEGFHTINLLGNGVDLSANEHYWAAIAWDGTGSIVTRRFNDTDAWGMIGTDISGYHPVSEGWNPGYGFPPSSGGFNFLSPINGNAAEPISTGARLPIPYWFRLYDPSASFLMGPQGFTGAQGPAGTIGNLPTELALPIEAFNIESGGGESIHNPATQRVYLTYFTCPSTATYDTFRLYFCQQSAGGSTQEYTGDIGVGIFDNSGVAGNGSLVPGQERVGVPKSGTGLTQATKTFIVADMRHMFCDISLNPPVLLTKGKAYWTAFAHQQASANGLQMPWRDPPGWSSQQMSRYEDNAYAAPGGIVITENTTFTNTGHFWWELTNSKSGKFLMGPQGDAGATGPVGYPGLPGNTMIPYQPFSVQELGSTEFALTNQWVYYLQFIAPTTGTYTQITTITSGQTGPGFVGSIGGALYADDGAGNPGAPKELLAWGKTTFNEAPMASKYVNIDLFSGGANLTANTKYWVAFAFDNELGDNTEYITMPYPSDTTSSYKTGNYQNNGFTVSGFPDPAVPTSTDLAPFWFRVCDPAASFLVGPQGATGVSILGNEVSNPALPIEPYNPELLGNTTTLIQENIYYTQCIAPATATYTAMNVLIAGKTPDVVNGALGVAVYKNDTGPHPYHYTGKPTTKIGEGSLAIAAVAASWASGSVTLPNASFRPLAMSGDGRIMVGGDYGGYLWRSLDYGMTWTSTQTLSWGPNNYTDTSTPKYWSAACVSRDGSTMVACDSRVDGAFGNGKIFVSWSQIPAVNVGRPSNDNPDNAISPYGVGYLWKQSEHSTSDSDNFTDVCCSADGMVIAACEDADPGTIWICYNGGGRRRPFSEHVHGNVGTGGWEQLAPADEDWFGICCSDDGTVIAACGGGAGNRDGNIWVSTTGGQYWTMCGPLTTTWGKICCSADGQRIRCGVYGGNIWTSEDYGRNWTERVVGSGNLNWDGMSCDSTGAKLIAISQSAGADLGSWFSYNGGIAWTRIGAANKWRNCASSSDGTKFITSLNDATEPDDKIYSMGFQTGYNGSPIENFIQLTLTAMV